ncbi:response regulator [Thermodesulfobacteriota bacterium]
MTETRMKQIMVVEDEAVIALRLQQRLSMMGYEVVALSHSSEESLEKARDLRPDLILMDIKIPGNLDGIAVAKIVKSELDIPVVFLTAFVEDQIIERAKQAEPYGYIVKPFQDQELKAAVEIALYKKDMERRLNESGQQYRSMIDSMGDAIHVVDRDLRFLIVNPALIQWNKELGLETEVVGRTLLEVFPFLPDTVIEEYQQVFDNGKNLISEERTRIDDREFFTEVRKIPIFEKGIVERVTTIIRNITQRKQNEEALKKAHAELEFRVQERTRQLKNKTKSLEEVNTALEVLLKKRAADKVELEENVMNNLKKLITPYFGKIKRTKLDDRQSIFLSIIESNLTEIVSPFSRNISLKYLNLTPTEIQVANLIKIGRTTKQIAAFMNRSPRTIDTHRKNIRRKIGLEKKRANLRSHLLSFK